MRYLAIFFLTLSPVVAQQNLTAKNFEPFIEFPDVRDCRSGDLISPDNLAAFISTADSMLGAKLGSEDHYQAMCSIVPEDKRISREDFALVAAGKKPLRAIDSGRCFGEATGGSLYALAETEKMEREMAAAIPGAAAKAGVVVEGVGNYSAALVKHVVSNTSATMLHAAAERLGDTGDTAIEVADEGLEYLVEKELTPTVKSLRWQNYRFRRCYDDPVVPVCRGIGLALGFALVAKNGVYFMALPAGSVLKRLANWATGRRRVRYSNLLESMLTKSGHLVAESKRATRGIDQIDDSAKLHALLEAREKGLFRSKLMVEGKGKKAAIYLDDGGTVVRINRTPGNQNAYDDIVRGWRQADRDERKLVESAERRGRQIARAQAYIDEQVHAKNLLGKRKARVVVAGSKEETLALALLKRSERRRGIRPSVAIVQATDGSGFYASRAGQVVKIEDKVTRTLLADRLKTIEQNTEIIADINLARYRSNPARYNKEIQAEFPEVFNNANLRKTFGYGAADANVPEYNGKLAQMIYMFRNLPHYTQQKKTPVQILEELENIAKNRVYTAMVKVTPPEKLAGAALLRLNLRESKRAVEGYSAAQLAAARKRYGLKKTAPRQRVAQAEANGRLDKTASACKVPGARSARVPAGAF